MLVSVFGEQCLSFKNKVFYLTHPALPPPHSIGLSLGINTTVKSIKNSNDKNYFASCGCSAVDKFPSVDFI